MIDLMASVFLPSLVITASILIPFFIYDEVQFRKQTKRLNRIYEAQQRAHIHKMFEEDP